MTYVFAFVLLMGLWLWALFDCLATPADRVRRLPKIGWLAIMFVFWWIGALAWLWLGRPGRNARVDPWLSFQETTRVPRTGPKSPIGPDDDPEFLNRLK